jgi:hypothetical protein
MKVILKQAQKCLILGKPDTITNTIESEREFAYGADISRFLAGASYLGTVEKVEITFRAIDRTEDGDSE